MIRVALRYASLAALLTLFAAILSGRVHAQDFAADPSSGRGREPSHGGEAPQFYQASRPGDRLPGAGAAAATRSAAPSLASRELALALARVSFNEADDSAGDLELLAQIVIGHGESDRARLAWLVRHSPCVTGRLSQDAAYARPGRCRWTRNLGLHGRRPRGWLDDDGAWSPVRARWLAHLDAATEYVTGLRVAAWCPVVPDTWDGWRWRERVLAEGVFVELKCRAQTRNVPYLVRGRR